MTHKIAWRRTIIGGDELHHDFCALVDGNITIARIYRAKIANNEVVWSAHMLVGHGGGSSIPTRRDAILWVEDQFIRFVEAHSDDDPQEWVPDQRSMELRLVRQADPVAYRQMIEYLRSGLLKRIEKER
jgi:hypothetical protein